MVMKKKMSPLVKENLGKLLLDFAKLTFASFILGGILRGELPQYFILLTGAIATAILVVMGLWFLTKEKE
jgi:putative Mn2+ efflux pump MntP